MASIFRKQTVHELLDSDKTTPSTVLDSDKKLKQSLHNMFPSTDATDTNYWTQQNVTVTESGTSPSGKAAYLLTEGSNVGASFRLYDALSVTIGRYYALSVDVKLGSGSRKVALEFGSGGFGANVRWLLDLDTGDVSSLVSGTKDSAIATELSDGWWNFTVYAEATTTTSPAFNIILVDGTSVSYNGDGSSGIYVSRPRAYEASVHVPVERVTNGDFASDSDWTKGSGWTISGGTLSADTTSLSAGTFTATDQTNIEVTAGETYRFEHTTSNMTNVSSGDYRYAVDGFPGAVEYISDNTVTADGTYVDTFTIPAGSNVTFVRIKFIMTTSHDADETMDIDNVSLTKVINDGIQNDTNGEDFIETSGSAVYHGGLEYKGDGSFRGIQSFEGRTNVEAQSGLTSGWTPNASGADTLTQSAGVGLDGDTSQVKLSAGTNNTAHFVDSVGFSASNATDYTLSAVLEADGYDWGVVRLNGVTALGSDKKAYFNLANGVVGAADPGVTSGMVSLGGGKYRCWITVTTIAAGSIVPRLHTTNGDGVLSFVGDGSSGVLIEMVQLEQGSSPSPYIPTTGSTRNRVKDTIHKDLVEFGFNQNELTVLCEFESAGSTGSDFPWAFCISDGSGDYRYGTYGFTSGSNKTFILNINSDEGAAINANYESNYTPYSTMRAMFGFKGNDNAVSDDGDTVATNSRAIPENVNLLNIASENSFGQQLNGHVKKLIIWPKRLSNATLESESV